MMDVNTKELFKAAKKNLLEKVVSLIEEKGLPTTVQNKRGRTIGHFAVRNANFKMLKYIVDKDPSILRIRDEKMYNIFHLAVKRDALDMVKFLVEEYNEDIFQVYPPDLKDTGTALHRAVKFGYLDMVKYFIDERHVDVNGCVEDQKQPPLFLAVKYKHPKIVHYLVDERNADLTLRDCNGEHVLYQAVRNSDLSLVKHLLDEKKAQININKIYYYSTEALIFDAIQLYRSNMEMLRYLVEQKNADLNIEALPLNHYKVDECIPVRQVSLGEPIVKYLVEHGARFNTLTSIDKNLLHNIDSEFFCKLIEKHGIGVDEKGNYDHKSPLYQAIEANLYKICVCLVKGGASLEYRDYYVTSEETILDTPLDLALRLGRVDLIKYLTREMKIDLNAPDNNGLNPLHRAAGDDDGRYRACQLLVRYGADVNRQDAFGYTALHYAAKRGNLQLCRYLVNHGADPHIRNNFSRVPAEEVPSWAYESFKVFFNKSVTTGRSRRSAVDYHTANARPRNQILGSGENELPKIVRSEFHRGGYFLGPVTTSFQLQNWLLFTQLLFQNVMNFVLPRDSIISPPRTTFTREVDPVAVDAVIALPDFIVRD